MCLKLRKLCRSFSLIETTYHQTYWPAWHLLRLGKSKAYVKFKMKIITMVRLSVRRLFHTIRRFITYSTKVSAIKLPNRFSLWCFGQFDSSVVINYGPLFTQYKWKYFLQSKSIKKSDRSLSIRELISFNLETKNEFDELQRQMVYAHAAYGFGAIYLEFGFIQLLWIWIKNLRNRDSVIEKFQLNKIKIHGDTTGFDRTTYLARFLSEKEVWKVPNLINWRLFFKLTKVWT